MLFRNLKTLNDIEGDFKDLIIENDNRLKFNQISKSIWMGKSRRYQANIENIRKLRHVIIKNRLETTNIFDYTPSQKKHIHKDYPSKVFGYNLKKFRESRGIPLRVVANQTGLAESTIWNIEQGEDNFPLSTLSDIALNLGVDFKDMVDFEWIE